MLTKSYDGVSRDDEARRLLLTYNEADCVNLRPLADRFYCRLVQAVPEAGMAPPTETPRALV